MSYQITFENKRVWEFYQKNQHIDVEQMNVVFVELFEKIMSETNTTLNAGIANQILENIKLLQTQQQSQHALVNENINKVHQDINISFVLRLQEFKKDYIEDLKLILNNNTTDKIVPIIEKCNDVLQDKIKIIINDMSGRNQDNIMSNLKLLENAIMRDTNSLLNKQQLNKETIDHFVSSIDDRFSKVLINNQTLFNSILTATEQRLNSKIVDTNSENDKKLAEIKELSTNTNNINTQLHANLNEMLKKMENSSLKGRISENLLFNIIQNLYPSAEIGYVGTTKESGDIILNRKDKKTILFENKDYGITVGKTEIEKFYRDIDKQQCNGVLISQKTGIVNKENYEIEIYNGKVLMFLHNVCYDSDKIKVAVDIIDHFQTCIEELNREPNEQTNIEITKLCLEDINKDYQDFIINKLNHISTIKEYSQKLLLQVDNLKIPNLETILNRHFSNSISGNTEFACKKCNNYIAKNSKSLTAHLRGCKGDPATTPTTIFNPKAK